MKNKYTIFIVGILIPVGLMVLLYFADDKNKPNDSDLIKNEQSEIISKNGLHWHSQLAIYVKGDKVEIPPNVGLGAVHNPVHTHIEDAEQGVLHLEFNGIVRANDTMLGEFFKAWNKDMDFFGSNMVMKVNGVENTEFGNYLMKDGDEIELNYK